jgi:hypothetical protein
MTSMTPAGVRHSRHQHENVLIHIKLPLVDTIGWNHGFPLTRS